MKETNNKEIVKANGGLVRPSDLDAALIQEIKNTKNLQAFTNIEIAVAAARAQNCGLELGEDVNLIRRGQKASFEINSHGLRVLASRSGMFWGSKIEFGNDATVEAQLNKNRTKLSPVMKSYLAACESNAEPFGLFARCTVFKGPSPDSVTEVEGLVYAKDFYNQSSSLWKQGKFRIMLSKDAEVTALRRAGFVPSNLYSISEGESIQGTSDDVIDAEFSD